MLIYVITIIQLSTKTIIIIKSGETEALTEILFTLGTEIHRVLNHLNI